MTGAVTTTAQLQTDWLLAQFDLQLTGMRIGAGLPSVNGLYTNPAHP